MLPSLGGSPEVSVLAPRLLTWSASTVCICVASLSVSLMGSRAHLTVITAAKMLILREVTLSGSGWT